MHSVYLVAASLLGAVDSAVPVHVPEPTTLLLLGLLLLGVLRTRP
jgi:PEP-CTERM putative exosortase interaction domain